MDLTADPYENRRLTAPFDILGAPMTRTRLLLMLLALASLPASSCRSTGDECDRCSSDDDCKAGLFCSTFGDGSKRCGSGIGATTCR